MRLGLIILLLMGILVGAHADCKKKNWASSFKKGLSKCDTSKYIKSLFWKKQTHSANCCDASSPYWYGSRPLVFIANWWHSFEKNYRWNNCPNGFFLQGVFHTDDLNKLDGIQEGRCAKPVTHPYHYGYCYTNDSLPLTEWSGVCNRDYFVTGLYRGGCNNLKCIEKIKCCKMAPRPDVLDSLAAVKTMVMDKTLVSMAYLAHYLGYGWCGGCRSLWVGEDFRRNGDTWEAEKSHGCKGYMNQQRLSINYADWKFRSKKIQYGKPVITSLQPETIDSGVINNHSPTESTRTIERTEESVRTVTHTTTSSWKKSNELNIEISYTPPGIIGGFGFKMSYKFGYESSSTTMDSTQETGKKIFSIKETKTVPPFSNTTLNLVILKTRTTLPYTVTVITHFSSELRGFLRWGGGWDNPGTSNHHYKYRGSGDRPIFNYRFGDAQTPFYEALKHQSDTMQLPWLWAEMKVNHPGAQYSINHLTSEGFYEFNLNGKFDDVSGKRLEVTWTQVPYQRESRRDTHTKILKDKDGVIDMGTHQSIAKELPGDPAPVFPPDPELELDPVLDEPTESLTVTEDV